MSDNELKLSLNVVSLNVVLHITILFTILSLLFMLYITKITSTFINNELTHIVKDSFEKMLYTSKDIPITPTISLQGLNSTITNNITNTMISLIQTEINQLIKSNPKIQELNNTNTNLLRELTETTNTAIQKVIQSKIDTVNSEINLNVNSIILNFNFEYYINLFKQQDLFRETLNKNLFDNIKLVNIVLAIFLMFSIIIGVLSKTLTMSEVIHVFFENIVTFLFVGIVEFWFFTNVASKFVPLGPSVLYTSFFKYISSSLDKTIIKS